MTSWLPYPRYRNVYAFREIYVGFEGTFGDRHVNPRTLKANFLGNMVCCEGIVTKCRQSRRKIQNVKEASWIFPPILGSSVRPKVVRSVHYCPATKKTLERKYTDLTSYEAFPSSNVYPTEDENKNPLETEFGLSTYKDHQTFSIQVLLIVYDIDSSTEPISLFVV